MDMDREWAVRTDRLGRQYGDGVWGVQDVSLELKFGSIVALLGANGAGKSTLIHLLCGALKPTTGSILENPRSAGVRIGWCSQRLSLDWYLTVNDNVLLGARLAGLDRAQSQQKTNEMLEFVGLREYASSFADLLSGGQQQRIQIARALVPDSAILYLDEPSAGLDVEAAERLMEGLEARARAGTMILVSSHDIGLLESRCDSIVLLDRGRVVTHESRQSFLQRFAGEEVLEIAYEGQLGPDLLERISDRVVRVIEIEPLRLVISRTTTIVELLHLIETGASIRDIRRSSPGLREAYLTFAQQDRNSLSAGVER